MPTSSPCLYLSRVQATHSRRLASRTLRPNSPFRFLRARLERPHCWLLLPLPVSATAAGDAAPRPAQQTFIAIQAVPAEIFARHSFRDPGGRGQAPLTSLVLLRFGPDCFHRLNCLRTRAERARGGAASADWRASSGPFGELSLERAEAGVRSPRSPRLFPTRFPHVPPTHP